MLQVLQIEEKSKKEIQKVLQYAKDHPVTIDKLFDGPVGDNPDYICYVHPSFRCAFSFEKQPSGWYRHLSISIDDESQLPHPIIVETIMHEFGFEGAITDQASVWLEPKDNPRAVNILTKEENFKI